MNTYTGQANTAGKIKINFGYTNSYGNTCFKYQPMGGNTETSLNNRKTELNSEMMEVFCFRLLPVTSRDWLQK